MELYEALTGTQPIWTGKDDNEHYEEMCNFSGE